MILVTHVVMNKEVLQSIMITTTIRSLSSSASSTSSVSSMKPLHLLRAVYRQLKTPILSNELLNKGTGSSTKTATTTTIPPPIISNKLRSNEMTKYLMQQYRSSLRSSTTTKSVQQEQGQQLTSNINNSNDSNGTDFIKELFLLKQDLQQRAMLYELDASAEQQLSSHEISRRAAARAGLQLPEQYNNENDNSK